MNETNFSAFDVRGVVDVLTPDFVWSYGRAVAEWLPTTGSVVMLAIPTQLHIAKAATEGLRLQGRDVIDGGSGGKDSAISLIKTLGVSGAIVVSFDELEQMITLELYNETAQLVDVTSGLQVIAELINTGNIVPAAQKGELTHIA